MKIRIKHNGSEVEIENNHKYDSYIDVRHFVFYTIDNIIDKLNEK